MTFNLYVLQNQWLVVAVFGGGALVLLLWLTYSAMWRPRRQEAKEAAVRVTGVAAFFRWLMTFMPWAIVVIILGSVIYTITQVLAAVTQLPNW